MHEDVWTKKKILLIILAAIVLLVFLFFRIFGSSKEKNEIGIVTSTSKFYTVSNCVYRYITYLQSKDIDSLILVLDTSYKTKNSINKNNIIEKLGKLDGIYSFEARKMYQEKLNDHITKYYVYGYLREEMINQIDDNRNDYYVIVTLNTKNKTFSVTPYDGEIFKNGDNYEG